MSASDMPKNSLLPDSATEETVDESVYESENVLDDTLEPVEPEATQAESSDAPAEYGVDDAEAAHEAAADGAAANAAANTAANTADDVVSDASGDASGDADNPGEDEASAETEADLPQDSATVSDSESDSESDGAPDTADAADTPVQRAQPEPLDADMLRHGPRAIIYVFSGPHLGAEIALPLGTFLVGSDASCDIILNGSSLAARHASLGISMSEGNVLVDVKALDGGVSLEGAGSPDSFGHSAGDCHPQAGEPWYLGLTCLVWNRPGVAQPMPQIVVGTKAPASEESANETATNSVGAAQESSAEIGAEVGSDASVLASPQVLKLDTSSRDSSALVFQAPAEDVRKKRSNIARLAGVVGLFVLLGVLSVVIGPTRVSPEQYPEIVEKKIKEAGLPPLSVTSFGYGVEVRGEVKSDAERAQLYTLAQDLHFPIYLDRITVQNDRMQAVRTAFTARGFLPSVVMKDVALSPGSSLADSQGNSLTGQAEEASLMGQADSTASQDGWEERPGAKSGSSQTDPLHNREDDGSSLNSGVSQPISISGSAGGHGEEGSAGGAKPALAAPATSPDLAPAYGRPMSAATKEAGAPETSQVMVVSAYIKDRLLEESVFAALKADVPNLPPIKRHIVHQEELQQVLQPALDKAALGFAEVRYLPNKVEVSGEFDQEGLMRARMVLEETGRTLGIPLPSLIQVRLAAAPDVQPESTSTRAPELESFLPSGDTGQEVKRESPIRPNSSGSGMMSIVPSFSSGDVLGGLRVTGVTMTPMRFVTTSDGQRLFEGSELPSGYTLETISTSTLTLKKGGQMVTYPLRGSS